MKKNFFLLLSNFSHFQRQDEILCTFFMFFWLKTATQHKRRKFSRTSVRICCMMTLNLIKNLCACEKMCMSHKEKGKLCQNEISEVVIIIFKKNSRRLAVARKTKIYISVFLMIFHKWTSKRALYQNFSLVCVCVKLTEKHKMVPRAMCLP